ncbi:glutathione S-transferase family protein [Pseudomonas sp.]|uniref:glutathione S-transferase family protein n=1 Tax=Pseudomonas sp. TaxID=306 RepID=UPI00272CA6AA|nr:glutathione S-transferase family protein [Pseudomonas sp.]
MDTVQPYILYGVPHSLYTGKVRCYLRNQRIDYVERPTSHPDFAMHVVPHIGRSIIPVLQTPEGELIQDSIDIIDHFEKRGSTFSVYPDTPLQRMAAIIIEYYGGQAMLKQAMHYRWSFLDEQQQFLRHAFASGSGAEMADRIMQRMQSYLPRLGIHASSIAPIEASFIALLDILERHFEQLPYLLGGRPSVADYGLIGPMFAHLGRDPVPSAIMKTRAPGVYRWVERMTAPGLDVVEYPDCEPSFPADDRLPPTLEPLLRHIARDIFPELSDKIAFMDDWLARVQPADGDPVTDKPQVRQLGLLQTQYHGVPIEVGVEPYLMIVLQRATPDVGAFDEATMKRAYEVLASLGLSEALTTLRSYKVARVNNREVWVAKE